MLTTSTVFLQSLVSAGITHAFVSWGSDHPGMLEELERQRLEDGKTALTIVTAPNEMVALSAAQGYGQVTGKPAAVIVHVDVGTQVSLMLTRTEEALIVFQALAGTSIDRTHLSSSTLEHPRSAVTASYRARATNGSCGFKVFSFSAKLCSTR